MLAKPAQGYWVKKSESGPHVLGGAHHTQCPNCDKPFLQIAALDTSDTRLEVEDKILPVLPLLFCWTCNISQKRFLYRLRGKGRVQLIKFGKGGVMSDFPYPNYPSSFPAVPFDLKRLSSSEQQAIILHYEGRTDEILNTRALRYSESRHQIGGTPFLWQSNWQEDERFRFRCPGCKTAMPFLAKIGDDSGSTKSFVGNPDVNMVFNFCRRCRIVGVYQECD